MQTLAMDIGGTNTRIAVVDSGGAILWHSQVRTKGLQDIAVLIQDALKRYRGKPIESIGIGVAGPVNLNKAELTNADLTIDAGQIEKKTGLKVQLLNDFAANGYGIHFLKKKDLITLAPAKNNNRLKMVAGPGTGLGKAYVIEGKVYPTEGGHTLLAIKNEFDLLHYLQEKLEGTPYFEDVVSGRGLVELFAYLAQQNDIDRDLKAQILSSKEGSRLITSNTDIPLCDLCVRTFVRFFARFVRISVLHFLCGEVYLAGGISPGIQESLKRYFMEEFLEHRTYKPLLETVGVSVVANEHLGLLGAAYAAMQESTNRVSLHNL